MATSLDKGEALVTKLNLVPEQATLSSEKIQAVAAGAAALKGQPTPALWESYNKFLSPKGKLTSAALAVTLEKAIADEQPRLTAVKKAWEKATAEKTAADAALQKANDEKRPQAEIDLAQARVTRADEALAKTKTTHEASLKADEEAGQALTSLKSGIDRSKKLVAKDPGSLFLAWKNYASYGKKLLELHEKQLGGTRLPGLVKEGEKAKPAEIHAALTLDLPAFRAAEQLNRPLRKMTSELEEKGGFNDTLLQPELAEDPRNRDYGLVKGTQDEAKAVDETVAGFPSLFRTLRLYAGVQAANAANAARQLRGGFARTLTQEAETETAPHAGLEQLSLARNLLADLKRLDEAWPLTAVQLREVKEYERDVERTYQEFEFVRQARVQLSMVVQVLDDLLMGDTQNFVNQQVRLFYFTNVPRLLESLNERTFILNPEGREAVERSRTLTADLFKAEQEVFEKSAGIATLKRSVEIKKQELAVAERVATNARNAEIAAQKQEAETRRTSNLTAAEAAKKSAALTKIQQDLADANAALMMNMGDEALAGKVAALRADERAATLAKAEADAEATKAAADLKGDETALTQATNASTEAKKTRDDVRNALHSTDEKAKGLVPQLEEGQQKVAELRRAIATQAVLEAEAFGTATDQTPIYLAPANGNSDDPVHRVMLYGYGDNKTLFIRGLPEDVEKTLAIIAGFDRPAPQARVTLWTLQLNGRDPTALNNRVAMINRELRYLRNNIASVQGVLREAVSKEVNLTAQSMIGLTRGSLLEMDQRLNRYFFYPREIRERLGFRLPYMPWWNAALTLTRLQADLDEVANLITDIQSLNRKIQRTEKDKERTELRKQRELLDEFALAAFLEAREGLERATVWATQLSLLNDCLTSGGAGAIQNYVQTLQNLRVLSGAVNRYLQTGRAAQSQLGKLSPTMVDTFYLKGYGGTRAGGKRLSREELIQALNENPKSTAAPTLLSDLENAETIEPLFLQAAHLAQDDLRRLSEELGRVARSLRPEPQLTQLPNPAATPDRMEKATSLPNGANLRLSLLDTASVTAWTLPDPVRCTTLGETMFVLTLGRRSARLRVLRDFTRELVKLSGRSEDVQNPSDHDEAGAVQRRQVQYREFLNDSIEVLRSLITADGGGVTSGVTQAGSPIRATAFPALPKTLFGALNTRSARLNDDELTAYQHEVLAGLLTKGREVVSKEVKHLIHQVALTAELFGAGRIEADAALRYRDQYLPLIGWLTRSYTDSPSDFREIQNPGPRAACTIPLPYRVYGANTLRVVFGDGMPNASPEGWMQADRAAWMIATDEAKANSLSIATARVAAADEMLKRLMTTTEDDLDHYFVSKTLRSLQDAIHDQPGFTTRLGEKIAGVFGQPSAPRVQFGLIERTSILATNRLVARVSPNANADVTLDGPEDFLMQAQQLAQLAQGVNSSFFAPKKTKNALTDGLVAAGTAKLAGAASGVGTLGPIGGIAALLSLLDEQKPEEPGEVYAINSGNLFKLTPIFDPSGQALRFKFDYTTTARVREPNGTTNPAIPRVERHTANTEVQISNLEVREVTRFGVNAQLGLPEKRTGGIPFIRNLPLLRDIPLVGYFTRQAAKGGVIQESVILGQTAIYPTVSDIADLLVIAPQRVDLGDRPPLYLRTGKQPYPRR